MLKSARFIGDSVLEACLAGRHRMMRPETGAAVLKVQQALLDLGYDLGPRRDDGVFGTKTGAAVTLFKQRRGIAPTDPVVGPKTMNALDKEFELPFADREEWLSWQRRPLRPWNFTRNDELFRQFVAKPFTFTSVSQWLPQPFQVGILRGLTALLDPVGSPDGIRTPSATWGASPLDLFHCHVVVELPRFEHTLDMIDTRTAAMKYGRRLNALRHEAESRGGPWGSLAWTLAYRDLLLAPGARGMPSIREEAADILNKVIAASRKHNVPVSLVWHSFESPRWRPATMVSADPRRRWWNVILPAPNGIAHTPFFDFAFVVAQILELAFLVNSAAEITVMAETMYEASAVVGLPMQQIEAAQFTTNNLQGISL